MSLLTQFYNCGGSGGGSLPGIPGQVTLVGGGGSGATSAGVAGGGGGGQVIHMNAYLPVGWVMPVIVAGAESYSYFGNIQAYPGANGRGSTATAASNGILGSGGGVGSGAGGTSLGTFVSGSGLETFYSSASPAASAAGGSAVLPSPINGALYGQGGGVSSGTPGTPNTGNGGNGNSGNAPTPGGLGGSGIVIISYPDSFPVPATITGTYTQPVRAGYRVYQFTGSGTIEFTF